MHILFGLGDLSTQAFVLGMAPKTSNEGIADSGMHYCTLVEGDCIVMKRVRIPNKDHGVLLRFVMVCAHLKLASSGVNFIHTAIQAIGGSCESQDLYVEEK